MSEEALTISKVKNIYIMLLHSITKENISIVDHFLDDNLTAMFGQMINENIKNNVKQKYGLLNISHVAKQTETADQVVFSAVVRFCDYKVDRKTNKVVEGNAEKTVTYNVLLHFRKNDVEDRVLYHCPSCGASLNHNATSICPYCNKSVDERYSKYVLTEISYKD